MHKTTGRWKLGLSLAITAAVFWGVLPIVLKLLLGEMDAYTITWYRFLVATLLLGGFQARRNALPRLAQLDGHGLGLLAVAIVGLMGNYLLYLIGLDFITPGAAQMVIQLAPVLLLLGGLIVFGERFGRLQWIGFFALFVGLTLFFNHRIGDFLTGFGDYSFGLLLIVASSFAWASYALAQKQLLKHFDSENILLLIYIAGVIVFFPAASPASLAELDGAAIALLVFACLNTLVAYGSFAEALDHWEASRVSAVLALAPLLTLICVALLGLFSDAIAREPLNHLSLFGGALIVISSMTMSLAGAKREPQAN